MSHESQDESVCTMTAQIARDGEVIAEGTAVVADTYVPTSISLEPFEAVSLPLSAEDMAVIENTTNDPAGVSLSLSNESVLGNSHYVASRLTYTPHPHSPEGRLDKMEEILGKLLVVAIEGETKQSLNIEAASMGVFGFLANREDETQPYSERLQELLTEFKTHLEEVKASPQYRLFTGYGHRPFGF